MKILKLLSGLVVGYALIVVVFEAWLGSAQPTTRGTMVVTTFDADGTGHDRVVSRLEHEGRLYVAANHWPRRWYRRALAHPEIEVTIDGERGPYTAVEIGEEEREAVDDANALGPIFRLLTGFPPRRILRLDPE